MTYDDCDATRALDSIHRILNDYGQECPDDPGEIVTRVAELMERVYNDDRADPSDEPALPSMGRAVGRQKLRLVR